MPQSGATTPSDSVGGRRCPEQDVAAISKANGHVSDAVYEAVKTWIETTNADTRRQDELALEGIRQGHSHPNPGTDTWAARAQMQRAYARVHLMIGAQRDPNVRVRRPERRVKSVFTLTRGKRYRG